MTTLDLPVTVRRISRDSVVYERGNLITFMTTTDLRPADSDAGEEQQLESIIRAVVCLEDGRFIAVPITYVRARKEA